MRLSVYVRDFMTHFTKEIVFVRETILSFKNREGPGNRRYLIIICCF